MELRRKTLGDLGDPQAAFTELYLREQSAVLRFVARRLPAADLTRAEDITQDAFIAAWRNLDAVPMAADDARAWLFSAARNGLLHEHRSIARRGALAVRIADEVDQVVPSPAEGAAQRIDLVAAWRSLDPGDQEVLALATWDGLDSAHAGTVLGISAANYRVRLHRARTALRRALNPAPQPARETTFSLVQALETS